MARAQVCRFYDDGMSGSTALRRPIKRLPEFHSSNGLFYSAKQGRRPPAAPTLLLHIPRSAFFQALFVIVALLVIFLTNSFTSPAVVDSSRSSVKSLADSMGVAPAVDMIHSFASRTLGATQLSIRDASSSSIPQSRKPAPTAPDTTVSSSKTSKSSTSIKPPSTSSKSPASTGSAPHTSLVRLQVPATDVKRGVSLAAVCMGRHDTVKKTIPAWLAVKNVDEIILVDWSSEPPLEAAVRSIPGAERIKVLRVNAESQWILSRAYNLAINASSFSHVIRTDCDYHIDPNFVSAHQALMPPSGAPPPKQFYAGNYELARNENEEHLNGAVFIRRKDFLDIGGYDERIQTYGWDDEDLYARLTQAGLKKMDISYDHVSHVEHGNSGRVQTGVKFATVEIDLNSILLKKLKPWSNELGAASQYNTGEATPNHIGVQASSKPKALKDLVSKEEYVDAWAVALGRRLHDTYLIPWDVIANLPIPHKELLLRRLMQRTNNRVAAKRTELDAAGKTEEVVDINALSIPRVLICHCMHGLGNRLRALASCMSYAKETSRELIVVWAPDSHIEARFSDVYKTDLVVMEKMTPDWPFAGVEKWDPVWPQFRFYNYMEMEGEGAVKGQVIEEEPNKHLYYKGAYIMEVKRPELTNWDKDNAMLRSLTPVDDVSAMVKQLELRGLGEDHVVALHVRNRTLDMDIKNVDFIKEYGSEATRTMDMWRHKSGVRNFMKLMNSLLKEKPQSKFFVATDTYEVIGHLEGLYGADKILSLKRTCDDRDGACVKFALADLYALAKCKALYGSNWSSFTEAAMRLGGKKAMLAGEDFGV